MLLECNFPDALILEDPSGLDLDRDDALPCRKAPEIELRNNVMVSRCCCRIPRFRLASRPETDVPAGGPST